MTERDETKVEWEIKHLKEKEGIQDKRLDNHADRLRTAEQKMEGFMQYAKEQLLQLFKAIERLEEKDRWEKRTFTGALLTMVFALIASAIIWAFQN